MTSRRKIFIFIILSVSLFLISCRNSNRFHIDTQKNGIKVHIHRFDKDLINIDTAHTDTEIKKMYGKYPDFFPVFISEILDVAPSDTDSVSLFIHNFLSDTTFAKVNREVLKKFSDVSAIEHQLSDAFTYIHYYFPEIRLPEIYFFVSGFNRSIIIHSPFIAIGSDLYLGADYPVYKQITYEYLTYAMRPENIAPDIVSALLFSAFPMNSSENRLLDNMLYRGKIMYLLSVFMPEEKPEILMGYTPQQWEWCKRYEREIWAEMIDKKSLFSTDFRVMDAYLNEAPFTAPVSQKSPGRVGTWIGWQIVKSYMEKNREVSLQQLVKENNYLQLLEKSDYRP
jgi:gliding motility-associated lipoprotein GldB